MSGAENLTESSFDWSPALNFLDDDSELLRDVAEAFLEECPRLMAAMQDAIDNRDGHSLQRASHAMTSAMQTFGLPGAADASIQLQACGRLNQFDDAPAYYAELRNDIDVLVPAAIALVQRAAQC